MDQERQRRLEPRRMETTLEALRGYALFTPKAVSHNEIHILNWETHNIIRFWPYSGWHTGKDIEDGRGFEHLVKQLKALNYTTIRSEVVYPKRPWWAFWRKR